MMPLRVGGLGDVAVHGDGLAAGRRDGGDDRVRAGLAGGVVDDDRRPSAASALAMAAPMPLDAPVTTATLPVSLLIVFIPLGDNAWWRGTPRQALASSIVRNL